MKIDYKLLLVFTSTIFLNINLLYAQIFVNQAGYINNLPKYFYTNLSVDSFYVIESSTGDVAYKDGLSFLSISDPATGMTLYRGDFSAFKQNGNYFIRIGNADSSFAFNISDSAFDDAYKKTLKGFFFQRCGSALLQEFAGVYNHPACHLNDAYFHSTTGETGQKQTTGGWHDAGDYGKYVVNAGITVGTLLMAYEMFPGKFNQDNLNIPESNNGIPDILDEVRYELEWLLKMQKSDGGIYFKVTREQFAPIILPQYDTVTRYIYVVSSAATGDFAALMSRAARIYKNIDTSFANSCLNSSLLAWNYLSANPTIVPAGGFKNPSGTVTGEYGDNNDSDERLWAAAELFNTTGEPIYKNYFESHFSSGGIINSTMWWGNVKDLAQLTYLTSEQITASPTIQTQIKNSLISYSNTLVSKSTLNGFDVSINPGEYTWGCNSNVLNNAVLLICAYEQSNNLNYYEVALMQLNYILGANAHNLSFITGVGSKSVMHPHHRPSWADGIVTPVPGLLAGGPDQYLDDDVLKRHFNSLTPSALCYIDSAESYACNEIAINWNAPLVFVLGYFNGEGITSVNEQGYNIVPEEFELDQNYPNPFNPTTRILYSVPVDKNFNSSTLKVQLKVYDVLGKEITTLIDEEQPAGIYETEFDSNDGPSIIPSGVYIYRLTAGEYSSSKKMILLK